MHFTLVSAEIISTRFIWDEKEAVTRIYTTYTTSIHNDDDIMTVRRPSSRRIERYLNECSLMTSWPAFKRTKLMKLILKSQKKVFCRKK